MTVDDLFPDDGIDEEHPLDAKLDNHSPKGNITAESIMKMLNAAFQEKKSGMV
jgi:hypothetical protein